LPDFASLLSSIKFSSEITDIRDIKKAQDSISSNGHKEINNSYEFLDMVHRLGGFSSKPAEFKEVAGPHDFFDSLFSKINERGIDSAPDFITIDSADDGSGVAPQSLMD